MSYPRRPYDKPPRLATESKPARFDEDDDKFTPAPVNTPDPALWNHTNRRLERSEAKLSDVRQLFETKIESAEWKSQADLAGIRSKVSELDKTVSLQSEKIAAIQEKLKDASSFTRWVVVLCVSVVGLFAALMRVFYGR